jgi:hypothetical protein
MFLDDCDRPVHGCPQLSMVSVEARANGRAVAWNGSVQCAVGAAVASRRSTTRVAPGRGSTSTSMTTAEATERRRSFHPVAFLLKAGAIAGRSAR